MGTQSTLLVLALPDPEEVHARKRSCQNVMTVRSWSTLLPGISISSASIEFTHRRGERQGAI